MPSKKIKTKLGRKPEIPPGLPSFVIGNGTSRLGKDVKSLMDKGLVVACNWFYRREFRPHVLVCSDEPITNTILKVDDWYPRTNWFYTWFPKPGSGAKKAPTPEKFAAGPMATYIAADSYQSKNVFLIGVDFFGFGSQSAESNGTLNNIYAGEKHYQKPGENGGVAPTYRNWQRRFQWIIKNKPDVNFFHVNPLKGKSPERLIGLKNFHQTTWEDMKAFLDNDTPIPLKGKSEEEVMLAYETNPDDIRACIERQVNGQENVLFPDMISYDNLLKIRLAAVDFQKKHPGQYSMINIMGFPIMLPNFGTSRKAIAAQTEIEYRTRYTTGGSTPPVSVQASVPQFELKTTDELPPLIDALPPDE